MGEGGRISHKGGTIGLGSLLGIAAVIAYAGVPGALCTVRTNQPHSSFTPCEQRMIRNVQLLDRIWADRVERHFRRPTTRADQPYTINFYVNCEGRSIQRLDPNCTHTRHTIEQLGLVWFGRLVKRMPVVLRAIESDSAKRWRTVDYGVDVDFIEPGGKHEDSIGGYVCNFGPFTLAHSLHSLLHFNMLKQFTFDGRDDSRLYLPAVLSHEMGHVFGLGHSSERGSVLTPQFGGVLRPSGRDYAGLESVFSNAIAAYDELLAIERSRVSTPSTTKKTSTTTTTTTTTTTRAPPPTPVTHVRHRKGDIPVYNGSNSDYNDDRDSNGGQEDPQHPFSDQGEIAATGSSNTDKVAAKFDKAADIERTLLRMERAREPFLIDRTAKVVIRKLTEMFKREDERQEKETEEDQRSSVVDSEEENAL